MIKGKWSSRATRRIHEVCGAPVMKGALREPLRKTKALRLLGLFTLSLVAWASMPPLADGADPRLPENAQKSAYGDRWECDPGYQSKDGGCVPVVVPENAYATGSSYGKAWECKRGFKEVDRSACIQFVIPEGAFLDASGARWKCARGYRKVRERCEEIVLPENAYLTENNSGSDWACERRYQKTSDSCELIEVPENAFLTNSDFGAGWECERGFLRVREACSKVQVPENGFLDKSGYGLGWSCERGYREADGKCVGIELPENAHLDRSGNRWECDRNFEREQDACVLKR